jgi:hypothetical protein
MKRTAKFSTVVLLVCVLFAVCPRAEQHNERAACLLIGQALRDYEQVKNAHTRGDVLRDFVPDGGLQFPAKTRYVYAKCSYLFVDVEFELAKPTEFGSLPEDKVTGVSKLYVAYPAKD